MGGDGSKRALPVECDMRREVYKRFNTILITCYEYDENTCRSKTTLWLTCFGFVLEICGECFKNETHNRSRTKHIALTTIMYPEVH